MPTEIIINSCKFYNQLKSGLNFGTPTDPTLNLAGNVGERIRLELEIGIAWYFRCNDSNYLIVVNGISPDISFTRQSGSWIDDGFSVGDIIHVEPYCNAVINNLNDSIINASITAGSMLDGNYSNASIVLTGDTPLTSLIYKFGLIGNNDIFNILSKISNNEQVYYGAGINQTLSPPVVNMLSLGNYKDWITGKNILTSAESTVQWQSNALVSNVSWQNFKITHQFIINPWYIEDWKNNFENGTIPSLLTGLNSLKYVFECEFRNVLSNPNGSKIARIENNLGSIGFFNENYNGFNNKYSIQSISYKNTGSGASCNGLQRGARTTTTIIIATTDVFHSGNPNGIICSLCTKQVDYQDKLTTAEENFLFDDCINKEGSGSIAGTNGIIKNFSSVMLDSTHLKMIVEIEYSAMQQLLISDDVKFIIGCQIADDTLISGNSDKVMLLADYNTFVASSDIIDLMYVTGFEMFQHFVTDPTSTTGTTKADIWNEDGLTFKFDFWLDLAKNALLNSLKFLVIAYDSTTGKYFVLDQYAINLNSIIVSGGVQQININTTRGYKLNASDYKNKVIITTGANIGGKQYYKMYIGQKTPWQAWMNNPDADTFFYDNTKPNNNLNFKSSNYSNLHNYQIKFALLANVYGTNSLGVSGNTDYLIISPDMIAYDYDLPTTWVATIETFDSSGTINLGGVIRTDADTLMRITWVRIGAFIAGYHFWAIHRIEESNESGTNIYELSSIISSISNNLLKILPGESFLKMTITSATKTVVTECLIDYTKLDSTKNYKISGRIDDGNAVPWAPISKEEEDGTIKITEDGFIKIVE